MKKKTVSNYIIVACSIASTVLPAIFEYRSNKKKIKRHFEEAGLREQLNRTDELFNDIFKMKNDDKIRTQLKETSTGEVLNKKNIDEKIKKETNEEKKRFYEYLKSEFLV